jgi:heme exporter protein CcmD
MIRPVCRLARQPGFCLVLLRAAGFMHKLGGCPDLLKLPDARGFPFFHDRHAPRRGPLMSGFLHLWWSDWAAFWRMGRYALYVWGSVAAVAVGLAGEQLALWRRARRVRRAQTALQMAAAPERAP